MVVVMNMSKEREIWHTNLFCFNIVYSVYIYMLAIKKHARFFNSYDLELIKT